MNNKPLEKQDIFTKLNHPYTFFKPDYKCIIPLHIYHNLHQSKYR
jgi:hypothetical protein